VGVLILLVGGGAYLVARETSLFAVRSIEVRGAPPELAGQIRQALAPLVGTSLVTFDASKASSRLAALPGVAAASYDRAFPHTLRVFVRAEQPVAVARQGSSAWLVSARARVLEVLAARPYPPLPRVWLPASGDVAPGDTLSGAPAEAVRVLALVRRLRWPVRVRLAGVGEGGLTLVLGSGLDVRLGDASGLALKLAVARRIVPLARGACYVDVAVPGRSVAGYACATSSRG
jgi:cell division septal protein FtsQ